jgi:hypothetical protein
MHSTLLKGLSADRIAITATCTFGVGDSTLFVYFKAGGMQIVMARDANAASRLHEGHKNSNNLVTMGICA